MSDTELLKRLAEREGVDLDKHRYVTQEGGIKPDGTLGCGKGAVRLSDGKPCETHVWYGWNPLTNDADAFALLPKLLAAGWVLWQGEWIESGGGQYGLSPNYPFLGADYSQFAHDPDLRRAICLAVDAMEGEQ